MNSHEEIELIFNKIVTRYRREFRRNLKNEIQSLSRQTVARKLAKSVYNKANIRGRSSQKLASTKGIQLVKEEDSQKRILAEQKPSKIEQLTTNIEYSYFKETFEDILSGNRNPVNLRHRANILANLLKDVEEGKGGDEESSDLGTLLMCYIYFWTCKHFNAITLFGKSEGLKDDRNVLRKLIVLFTSIRKLCYHNTLCSIAVIASRGGAPIVYMPIPVNEDLSNIDIFLGFLRDRTPFLSTLNVEWLAFTEWTAENFKDEFGEFVAEFRNVKVPDKQYIKSVSSLIDDADIGANPWVMLYPGLYIVDYPIADYIAEFPLEVLADETKTQRYVFLLGNKKSSYTECADSHTFIIQIFGVAQVRFFGTDSSADPSEHIEFSKPFIEAQYPHLKGNKIRIAEIHKKGVIYVPKSEIFCITSLKISCMIIITLDFFDVGR